jgi:hypothetical protein
VTYFDILGFKDVISTYSAQDIYDLLQLFQQTTKHDAEEKKPREGVNETM